MKKTLVILMGLSIALLTSCVDKGVTSERLAGNEETLPAELKGLKIYSVSVGGGSYVKVAILNNKPISTTYQVGKYSESTVIVDKTGEEKIIHVESIISENDSIIVIKKATTR
jgi:hypothetical protein